MRFQNLVSGCLGAIFLFATLAAAPPAAAQEGGILIVQSFYGGSRGCDPTAAVARIEPQRPETVVGNRQREQQRQAARDAMRGADPLRRRAAAELAEHPHPAEHLQDGQQQGDGREP